jgi:hypothetical protein
MVRTYKKKRRLVTIFRAKKEMVLRPHELRNPFNFNETDPFHSLHFLSQIAVAKPKMDCLINLLYQHHRVLLLSNAEPILYAIYHICQTEDMFPDSFKWYLEEIEHKLYRIFYPPVSFEPGMYYDFSTREIQLEGKFLWTVFQNMYYFPVMVYQPIIP